MNLNKDKKNEFNCKILIIGDNVEYNNILANHINDVDCKVITASTEEKAFSLLRNDEFALVLITVKMKDVNGFDLAERMRKDPLISKTLPVIFLTTLNSARQTIKKGYKLQAADYLFHPVDPFIMKSKVNVFIALYNQKELLKEQQETLKKQVDEMVNLQNANNYLSDLSMNDGLTSIANKRHFDNYMMMSWNQAYKHDSPLSLIMCDIDYFKEYNDNYGHLAGDKCLKVVAKTIEDSLYRQADFVARFGGEEFVIVLPDTSVEDALHVVNRIKYNLAKADLKHDFSPINNKVTLSFGITSSKVQDDDLLNDFIQEADIAMYEAKNSGRNTVKVYKESTTLNGVNNRSFIQEINTEFFKDEK